MGRVFIVIFCLVRLLLAAFVPSCLVCPVLSGFPCLEKPAGGGWLSQVSLHWTFIQSIDPGSSHSWFQTMAGDGCLLADQGHV
jgi:hypothetical protein